MNGERIDTLLRNNPVTEDIFKGVYPSDKIPRNVRKSKTKQGFVFNVDPSYKEGSHWVALVIAPRGEKNIYFDSYGLPPFIRAIKRLLKKSYIYNKEQLQHSYSTACGQWCLFFLFNEALNTPMKSVIEKLKREDKLKNDHHINYLVNLLFNTREKVLDRKFLRSQLSKEMKTVREGFSSKIHAVTRSKAASAK